MQAETQVDASTVVAGFVARRATKSGAVWGVVFGVYVAVSASGFVSAYPTYSSRVKFALSVTSNTGFQALLGPARRIETIAGFTAWRSLGVMTLVGGVWALLAGTRLLRGEEDAGRWELMLTGPTTRARATAQALAGLAAGWVALFGVTAIIAIAEGRTASAGFSVTGATFLAVALTASSAMFLIIGAVASQLAATRRQAAALAGGALGVAYMIRMVADSGSKLEWIRWASPLGWVEQLRPLTGSRPAMLIPVVLLVAALSVVTVWLAGRRDVGASILRDRDTASPRTGLLGSPLGLAVRLERPIATAWIVGLAVSGLAFGLVAQSASAAVSGSATVVKALNRLGGMRGGADAYLGLTFLVVTTLVALIAAGQVNATREEEADGRLDNILVRPIARWSWLGGRFATAAVLVIACAAIAGMSSWAGAASQQAGVSFWRLTEAGLNAAAPALFVLGAGTLLHATVARIATAATYGLVAWSFLIELIGSVIKANPLLLDTSILHHVTPAPAADPNWASAAALVALGLAAAGLGAVLFTRRDLASA